MEEQDKLRGFYDALKSNSNISGIPEGYEQFKSVLADKKKAEPFYENLKSSGVVSGLPNDFESFSTILPKNKKNDAPDINVLKKDYNDFMSQNKDFLDTYREDVKRRQALSPTPIGIPLMLSSLFKTDKQREEDNRYKELSAREEELSHAISTHPETLGKKKILMDSIDESIGDLDAMMQERRKNVPVSFANSSAGGIVMGEGSDLELNRLDAANKMYKDAKELLKAPSKFDDSNPFMNFMKGAGDTFNDRDFWSFGLTEIGRNLKMKSIFKKVSENTEGKDLDKILSPGEQKMLEAFTALSSVEAERAKDLSLGYSAGEGATESLKFMAEFIATGGVASAASSGAKKAVSKWLVQNTKNGLMRELGKGLSWGTEAGLSTLARTPLMPSTYANITTPSNQFETDENGETLLDENGNPVLKSEWKVFRDGFVDSFIENLSEMSGAHISGILGIGGRIAGKAVPKKVQDVFGNAGDLLAKSKPGEMFKHFSKSPVWKFLKQGGYDGLLEEWGEEWYGAAVRSVLTDPNALKDYATVDNQLVTIASFLPMSVFGGGASAGRMIRAKGKYNTTLSALQGLMGKLGYNGDQIAYLTDQIELASAQKMSSTVAPIINNLALENEEMAGELFKAVSDFAKAKGDYHLLNGAYHERMAERRADEDKRMEAETGGYVNTSTGNVEMVVDGEGNTAYVVGETLDDGHKIYILNKGGEKVPVSREDFEEGYVFQGTFGKDEFLGNIIMSRDLEEAAVREAEVMNGEGVVPEPGNSGVSMTSYQGRPVQVLDGTEMEDGTVIVEDESGETMRVPAGDLEINDVAVEEPGGVVQEENGVVQSESEENNQSEIPRTIDGMPDYDSMSPEMFAVEFEREFGADAARGELEQMSADIDAQVEKLQKKSLTNRNERAENMREIARLKGEQDNIQKALERYSVPEEVAEEKEPVFSNEEEAVRWVMENSDDINEVLGTYESVRELQKDATLPRWQQELQGIKINPESFYRESDRNLATPELKRGWLNRNGRNIDEVAHDLSNYGIEVTTQDIVDFMLENPSGRVRQKSGELDALGQRFSELATKSAGVKIGKPDSPTGKLFIENLRNSNDMEQLRNQINDAQRAEEEVLRSMAEQREAERESNMMDEEIKPVGKGVFGNIYDQFRGKAKDAVRFLLNHRGGDLLGVFHRNELGDIDLIWGNKEKNQGLDHIIDKHVNQLHDFSTPEDAVAKIEDVINNGNIIKDKWDKATFEKDGYRVVVRKNVRGDNGEIVDEKKNWVVTAFDNDKSQKEKSSSATTLATPDNTSGSRAVASDEVSTVKGTESFSDTQEEEGKSSSPLFREGEERKESDPRFRFIGEKGAVNLDKAEEATTRLDNLGVAREMEESGKDAKAIKLATGWERGADGKWRYETEDLEILPPIDLQPWYDEFVSLRNRIGFLSENEQKRFDELTEMSKDFREPFLYGTIYLDKYVKDKNLFKTYPELKDLKLVFDTFQEENFDGAYDESSNRIYINLRNKYLDKSSIISHEIQHVIQNIEGFARGGNEKLGEMIAKRMDKLTDDQREFVNSIQLYNDWKAKGTLREDYTVSKYVKGLHDVFSEDFYRNIITMTDEEIQREYNRLSEKGSSVRKTANAVYKNMSGEVEARNVQSRLNMTPEERRNSLASETEDVAREDQIFLNDALGMSASMDTSVDEVNRRFNEELEKLTEANADNVVLSLGKPNDMLKSAGISDKPMKLYGNKVIKKMKKHGFALSELRNLPEAVANPIAVFDNLGRKGNRSILTELRTEQGNFLVTIDLGKDADIDFNIVSSVFGKGNDNVVDWINKGYATYINKEKAISFLSHQSAPIAAAAANERLNSATNIVENFENPTLEDGEIVSAVESLASELNAPVRIVRNVDEIKDEDSALQRKKRGSKGWYDPKTGEVVVILPNADNVRDAQATMLHEIVGHKGIHGLFGDRIGEFASRVLDSMPEAERKKWVDRYNGNERLAAEEYVARFAEGYENPSMWEKIKAIFRDLLRGLGIDLKLSDNDLKYILWKGVRSMQQDGTMLGAAEYVSKDREIQRALFREEENNTNFSDKHLSLGEHARENFQDRMLSVKMLLDEVKKRGGKVTDYSNPYVAENMATSKSKAQIGDFNKRLWDPLLNHVKTFSEKGKTREEIDHYMMAKHAPERNALLKERNGVENGSGMTDEDAMNVVSEFEKSFDKDSIDAFWDSVREATRFTVDTWQKHGLIDKATRDYYNNMYQYYVPLRGWESSEADNIEYLDGARKGGTVNVNKKAKGRSSLADSPLAYIANMAHSAIVSGNKNDIKRNVFEMMALNKNPDLYHLKKVYHVNTGTKENPIWIEQLERPDAKLWNEGRVKVDINRKNDARREFYKTKQHQVEVFVNGQKYVMEFNGNMGVRVANAINGLNVIHSELLQNTVGQVTRWMSANFTSKNPEFVVTNFLRDFGYAIPAYWIKGGKASVLLKNMPKAFRAIHNDIAGKNVDSELQKMYEEFKMNGGLTGYVHMTDIDSYKKWIERDIRKMSGDKTFGDVVFRNKAMRAGADLLEYLAQMSENSTRFAVYMSERQSGKSVTEAAYAAKEITTNFNRKGRYSSMLGSLYGFFNATVQGTANALGLAKRSPGKFGAYCGALIMLQVLSSSLCRMFGGDDEIGENNYDRLADWVKYNNLVLPDLGKEGRFITIPLPHFFRALSSLGVIGGEVLNGVKTPGKGLEAMFDAVSGDLTPVEIATPQFKNLPSFLMSVTPTAFKPITEAYAFNRNFMNLPISREAMGDQKKTLPQNKLAKKTTNPTLVSISKWLNEAAGGGEYTTAEIGYDDETGEVGRNDWKTWMDVNPAKFEHVVEGIFGGRLKFFNNIYKTASNILTGEFEASTTPIIRPLYQTPKGESAWIKFYEVRDEVVDIDAKASEFMKIGNYDAYGMINYRNAQLVETYKAYETIIKSLNDALKMVSDPEQASEIEKKKDDVVKEFAIEVKKLEKEYKSSKKKKEVVK